MIRIYRAFKSDNSGASASEYALLIGVLGALIVAGVTALGGGITSALNKSANIIATHY